MIANRVRSQVNFPRWKGAQDLVNTTKTSDIGPLGGHFGNWEVFVDAGGILTNGG